MLSKDNFHDHYAEQFPVEQIVEFVGDKEFRYLAKGSECENCGANLDLVYRRDDVSYDEAEGFNLKEIGEPIGFAIVKCSSCKKWISSID
ncbi:hypothetical protein [Anaeromicrobium sediminis]|uniref:Uncharacterized protein n=1 Tax=Anaeromicrobium sediminis TaxID=1478221 RepID=A0A267MQH6_9FIRM|nr:hypothetical protein [Anaeromicrobium sediminis]PAB61158.1 hypothetical protein CCE28_01665 [Anaeromicrobium sediminis]